MSFIKVDGKRWRNTNAIIWAEVASKEIRQDVLEGAGRGISKVVGENVSYQKEIREELANGDYRILRTDLADQAIKVLGL